MRRTALWREIMIIGSNITQQPAQGNSHNINSNTFFLQAKPPLNPSHQKEVPAYLIVETQHKHTQSNKQSNIEDSQYIGQANYVKNTMHFYQHICKRNNHSSVKK